MANWATLYRQRRKLPVLAPDDPKGRIFRCARLSCALIVRACVERYQLAQKGTAHTTKYGVCQDCPIGSLHAQGKYPSPNYIKRVFERYARRQEDDNAMTVPGQSFRPRPCKGCGEEMTPKGPTDRYHPQCRPSGSKRSKPKGKARNARVVAPAPRPAAPAKRPAPAPVPGQAASIEDLLRSFGYQVEVHQVPQGVAVLVKS